MGFLDFGGPLRGGFPGASRGAAAASDSDLENGASKKLDNLVHGHLNFLGTWLAQIHQLLIEWHRSELPTVSSNFVRFAKKRLQ